MITDNHSVVDFSRVSPQRDILASYPKKPEADSKIYLDHRQMNGVHELVGIHIILARDNPNGLWEIFHKDRNENKIADKSYVPDILSVDIYCDTLEIHGALCIPEANVTIMARKVIWATTDASLNTTPLEWQFPKAQEIGVDGMHGRRGGRINFVVSQSISKDKKIRLYAQGGNGQSPGRGVNGAPGASVESRDWVTNPVVCVFKNNSGWKQRVTSHLAEPPVRIIRVKSESVHLLLRFNETLGTDKVPTNGQDAIAPGIPGSLGNGGKIATNQATLFDLFDNTAGQPGNIEMNYKGGAPGTPIHCCRFRIQYDRDLFFGSGNMGMIAHVHKDGPDIRTQKGEDRKALPAAPPKEKNPELKIIPEENAWIHPLSLVKVLEFGRELFLSGARQETLELLSGYKSALNKPMPQMVKTWQPNSSGEWVSAQLEVASMLHRLRGHLDYFGHRGGYIPLLSLQGAIKLYKNEAKRCLVS